MKTAATTKGDRTRQRILEKAAPIFNRKGYEGCSMQDVTAATGLEKASIYRYFPSKEDLALQCFDYATGLTASQRIGNLDQVDNSIDKLKLHIHNMAVLPCYPGGCPIFNTAIDSDDANPQLRTRARKALNGWKKALADILRNGQLRQEVRPEIDPQDVAVIIIALTEGATAMARLSRSAKAEQIANKHLNTYLESLRAQAPLHYPSEKQYASRD